MRIVVTSVLVDDQDKALEFYTRVLGFVKKTEIPLGEHRWLTVVSPHDPDGVELVLEPDAHPAADNLVARSTSLSAEILGAVCWATSSVTCFRRRSQSLSARSRSSPSSSSWWRPKREPRVPRSRSAGSPACSPGGHHEEHDPDRDLEP